MFYSIMALILGTIVIWMASEVIGKSGDNMAYHMHMPSIVKGAIIAAIASSFPEFATVILSATRYGVIELGIGTIIGSAVFNILIIPAVSQLALKKPLIVSKDVIYKEGFFYVIAIAGMMFAFFYSAVFNGDGMTGTITRKIAFVPFALYFMYLYMQAMETKEGKHEIEDFEPSMSVGASMVGLISGMVAVFAGVEWMIWAALDIGEIVGASPLIMGVVVCAAVTSIPDTLLSVRDALQGEHDASLANVFGSNVFDLLVCIPVGIFIVGSAGISLAGTVESFGFLVVITFITLILIRSKMKLDKSESVALLGMYGIFILWQASSVWR